MKDKLFNELLESIQEMDVIARGKKKPARTFHYLEPEVKAIRERTGLSQTRFAQLIGVSKCTLENWEQGRHRPTGPAAQDCGLRPRRGAARTAWRASARPSKPVGRAERSETRVRRKCSRAETPQGRSAE